MHPRHALRLSSYRNHSVHRLLQLLMIIQFCYSNPIVHNMIVLSAVDWPENERCDHNDTLRWDSADVHVWPWFCCLHGSDDSSDNDLSVLACSMYTPAAAWLRTATIALHSAGQVERANSVAILGWRSLRNLPICVQRTRVCFLFCTLAFWRIFRYSAAALCPACCGENMHTNMHTCLMQRNLKQLLPLAEWPCAPVLLIRCDLSSTSSKSSPLVVLSSNVFGMWRSYLAANCVAFSVY